MSGRLHNPPIYVEIDGVLLDVFEGMIIEKGSEGVYDVGVVTNVGTAKGSKSERLVTICWAMETTEKGEKDYTASRFLALIKNRKLVLYGRRGERR